jgi:probable F420-dependent oxidoreductase
MHLGIGLNMSDRTIGATELARALEERGFESLWATEHSHIPVERRTPFPAGGALPRDYAEIMDPFVVLAAAAAVTTRLRLGTGVCLIPQRDAIQTAKLVASLDQVSSGRFLFGVGNGWNAEEMAHHGVTDFAGRHRLAREKIAAMKAIWTEEEARFEGKEVRFAPMWSWPKPAQKPHPPIIVGGAFPFAARRAIAYGNGWLPHIARPHYADVSDFLPEFHAMARAAGRDPAELPVTVWAPPDLARERLERLRARGVARVVLHVKPEGADAVLPVLDRLARLIPGLA